MDNSRMKIFLHLIESNSLTETAAAFGYSISGVSHKMSSLEQELGFPLLTKTKEGFVPSENAKSLIPIMRSRVMWDELLNQEIADIQGVEDSSLTVASYFSVASQWLPQVISRFHQDYPRVRINVVESVWQGISDVLSEHRADLGFYSYVPSAGTHWIPLKSVPLVAVVPEQHPLAQKDYIRLEDLANETVIMPDHGSDVDVEQLFQDINLQKKCCVRTMHMQTALGMVEQGMGVTVTNELFTRGFRTRVKVLPLDPPRSTSFGVGYPSDCKLSPAAEKFMEYTCSIIRDERMVKN